MPFLLLIFPLLISCSHSDKFDANSKPKLELLEIECEQSGSYVYAHTSLSIKDEAEYYYYWIINGEHFYSFDVQKKLPYGEHVPKFVLIDGFGDTLSDNCDYIRINEPLEITLLSPVDEYKAEKTDTIKFQYKISGIDTWEENLQTKVYISTDKKVWEPIDSLFMPPFTKEVYYWKVKAFTEQDTSKQEEIRSIWIKK